MVRAEQDSLGFWINKTASSLILFAGLCFGSFATAEVAPDVLVKTTIDEVLEIVKNDKDIQAGNQLRVHALAEEKILPYFNFERVCRLVLGKNFTRASKEQQDKFQAEFRTLLLRTYSSALLKYKDQKIEIKPMRADATSGDVTVKTDVLQPNGQPIAIDYSLSKQGDSWKVYDIAIEGVSLVTNYRGQFSNEIRQNGMDGLIEKLVNKNKQVKS